MPLFLKCVCVTLTFSTVQMTCARDIGSHVKLSSSSINILHVKLVYY